MKSKIEVITEAWNNFEGIIPAAIDRALNNNGWMHWIDVPDNNNFDLESDPNRSNYCRPKILHGIEDNNGWISIKYRSEMPNEKCIIKICISGKPDKNIYQWEPESGLMYTMDSIITPKTHIYKFYDAKTSHYKIVELDKAPLY